MKHEDLNQRLKSMCLPSVTREQAKWLKQATGNRFERDVVEFKRMAFVPYQQWTPEFERVRDDTYMGLRTWLAKVFEVMCPIEKDWSKEQREFGQAYRLAHRILDATSRTRH